MRLCVSADVPAVATAAWARTIAASAWPGPRARSGSRARPEGRERHMFSTFCLSVLEADKAHLQARIKAPVAAMLTDFIPSPAATTTPSLAKAVAVIGVVAPVPTLVTPVIGVKLAPAGATTALPGHACWHLYANTGTTKNPEEKTRQYARPKTPVTLATVFM